jgi:aspartate aminotransferase
MSESVTLAITAKAKKMKREGRDVISFGAGEPDFDTPYNVKQAAIKAINRGFTKYTPPGGTAELKEAIRNKLKKENGLDYDTQQIVVSCGAKHTLYNLMQVLCEAGDEVLIPVPYWVSYPEMVIAAEGKPVFIRTDAGNDFKLSVRDLEKHFTDKSRILILNSPSNPTGCVYSRKEVQEIGEWAVRKGVTILSDEIYEKLIYGSAEHVSPASLGDEIKGATVLINGVSKAYCMTGWRIGYMASDPKIAKAVNSLQSHSTSNPASISQKAALEALTGDQSFIKDMRNEFLKRRDYMTGRINNTGILSCNIPKGAFYVFCDIKQTGMDSLEFSNKLLDEAMVAVVPGAGFGDSNYIRLSFASSMKNIEEGLNRIEKWVKR